MRRKRLKHVAFTLCQIFSGWELINSYLSISKTGSGVYKYDILNDVSYFNGNPSEKIGIYYALQNFFTSELANMKLQKADIEIADVTILIKYSKVNPGERKVGNEQFIKAGKPLNSPIRNLIEYECESIIKTDEATYENKLVSSNEWPDGWLK